MDAGRRPARGATEGGVVYITTLCKPAGRRGGVRPGQVAIMDPLSQRRARKSRDKKGNWVPWRAICLPAGLPGGEERQLRARPNPGAATSDRRSPEQWRSHCPSAAEAERPRGGMGARRGLPSRLARGKYFQNRLRQRPGALLAAGPGGD